jgi:hypothetical protein
MATATTQKVIITCAITGGIHFATGAMLSRPLCAAASRST